jgi:hypothetical protein
MACRRSLTSRRKSILRFKKKLKRPLSYVEVTKGECSSYYLVIIACVDFLKVTADAL